MRRPVLKLNQTNVTGIANVTQQAFPMVFWGEKYCMQPTDTNFYRVISVFKAPVPAYCILKASPLSAHTKIYQPLSNPNVYVTVIVSHNFCKLNRIPDNFQWNQHHSRFAKTIMEEYLSKSLKH